MPPPAAAAIGALTAGALSAEPPPPPPGVKLRTADFQTRYSCRKPVACVW